MTGAFPRVDGFRDSLVDLARQGRKILLDLMPRIRFLQRWYALSDPAMEEAPYEIASLWQFARLPPLEAIPDETTILHFQHLLERARAGGEDACCGQR